VRRQSSEFYLKKLRRDTIVFLPTEVQVNHRVMKGVRRMGEILDFTKPRGILKDCCRTESKNQITRGYLRMPQGVCAGTH
jgi:hypothetical protein